MPGKKILLLSAYDAASHQQWRRGLVAAFPEYEWSVLTLPPRNFSWRIRGNSLSWALSQHAVFEIDFDLIIATSMTDLAALKGMRVSLAAVPTLLYFHENQFAYPESGMQFDSVEPRITSIYSALAATSIVFNSQYNRTTFLQGVQTLLNRMPDHVPSGIEEMLRERSCTLAVPLDDSYFQRVNCEEGERFTILWNHRWEYDKAPERFFSALSILKQRGVDFRINVAGRRFRKTPSIFDQMRDELSEHIGSWGQVENRAKYLSMLQHSHVVVSTALHDFQGLSILEAVAAGCIPVVPDRLAYPEFIPDSFRYSSSLDEQERESSTLAEKLFQLAGMYQTNRLPAPPDISHLSWSNMRAAYRVEIERVLP